MEIEIPDSINERLERHSRQFGIEIDDLKSELIEYVPKIKELHPKADIKTVVGLAYRQLATRLAQEEGGLRSNAVVHTVFFIGDSGIKDVSEAMKRKILRMSPEEQRQFHPDENTWLDYREDRFMEPIESVDHRVLYGIGCSGDGIDKSRVKFVKLDLWRENVRKIVPEYGVLYKFRAISKETDKQLDYYDLNAATTTRLRLSNMKLTDEEKVELIRNCGKEIYTVDDIELLYNTRFSGEQKWNAEPVFIEGYVSEVIIREEKANIIRIYDDLGNGMKVYTAFVPKHLPLNLKESDRVILLADISELETNRGKELTLFVRGYFVEPIKGLEFV